MSKERVPLPILLKKLYKNFCCYFLHSDVRLESNRYSRICIYSKLILRDFVSHIPAILFLDTPIFCGDFSARAKKIPFCLILKCLNDRVTF